jgi:NTE family protein
MDLPSRIPRLIAFALAAACVAAAPLRAQSPEPADSTRVGVVLSGGSARGLAHIGVLRVLEAEGIPVDVVTGTSIGSLVGGLYATGYGADSLAAVVRRLPWDNLFSDGTERRLLTPDRRLFGGREQIFFPLVHGRPRLPSGAVAGRSIDRLLARLTWPYQRVRDFRELPIPFAAVATDIATGEAVVLDRGVLADAMRASMAIPGFFRPKVIDGRPLVDGGLARNLPAQDAEALGAGLLVCSDVSAGLEPVENLGSAVAILMQTITFQMALSTAEQRRRCDVVIEPDAEGLAAFAFGRADEFIRRGEEAARAKLPELRALRARAGARPAPADRAPTPRTADSVLVSRVEVRTPDGGEAAERIVRRALALPDGAWATPGALDEAVKRAYATDLFEQVTYRLEDSEDGTAAVFEASGNPQDRLGFGFRYDDRANAALLFSATVHNLLDYGSVSRVELRLGEEFQVRGQHLRGRGVSGAFSLGLMGGYTRATLDVFDGDERVAEVRSETSELSAFVGAALGRNALVGALLTAEHSRGVTSVAPLDTAQSLTFASASAVLFRETHDHPVFPTHGSRLFVKSEWSDRVVSGVGFSHHVFDLQRAIRLGDATALRLRATTGAATGRDDLPLSRVFFLGGAAPATVYPATHPPFLGLRPQQRFGSAVGLLRAGLQREVREGIFLIPIVNVGNTGETLREVFDDPVVGAGITLGLLTPAGPLEVTASGRRLDAWPRIEVSFGGAF